MSFSDVTHIGDAEVIGRFEPGTPEWHQLRATGIGGSEVAAVLGLLPWSGPHAVWMAKMGMPVDDETTIRMRVGTKLEPLVIALLSERTNYDARPLSVTVRHPEHDWWKLNTDGVVGEDAEAVVEAKTSSDRAYDRWMRDGVPVYYQCQVQYALGATGLPYGLVPCLFGGVKFEWWRIERDEDDIAAITEHVEQFWRDYVCTGDAPPIDGTTDARDYLLEKYGHEDTGEAVELSDDVESWVEQYYKARRLEKKAERLKREAQNHLIEAVGEAKRGTTPNDYRVTIVRQRRFDEDLARERFGPELKPFEKALDTDALRRERPDIYEAAKQPSSVYPLISGGPNN